MGGAATKAKDGKSKGSFSSKQKKQPKSPKQMLEEHVVAGREKEAMALLDKYPDFVNEGLDADGMRPLQIAARAGQLDVAKSLIDRGALLDQTNDAGATALMFAAAGGYEKICKLVLDAGANIRIEDKSHCSALQYAQLHNRTKVENILQMYACEFTW
mmetsp:Transcript_15592/g.47135  ORF Transcript_15592/g.47135 Transcript_15592/m.47135 type:complete len:158 (-) Transcript_15592:180-653(-)